MRSAAQAAGGFCSSPPVPSGAVVWVGGVVGGGAGGGIGGRVGDDMIGGLAVRPVMKKKSLYRKFELC